MAPPRKALFISYNFPPHGGAGVQRTLKFVKYLPEFGWQTVVVAATADAGGVQDPSLLSEIPPETSVFRVPGFSFAGLQRSWGRFGLRRLAVGVNLLLQLPDAARFWARSVRPTVAAAIRQDRPALIYTTSGPYSNHLVGLWARREFGLPWFADFRDPWSKNLLTPYPPLYRSWNQRLERRVLAEADRVATVSEPWLRDLQDNLGQEREKFMVLPNGYDEADVPPLPPPPREGPFTLTHLGSFYRNRRPGALVAAISLLVESGRIPRSELQVLFIGKNVRGQVPEEPPFVVHDYVPHQELAAFRVQSHAFVLLLAATPDNLGNYSGKIYEYMASNRPVLGIVPPGGVAEDLLQSSRTGIAVDDDVNRIAAAIETMYRQWRSDDYDWQPDWDVIHRYTRRNVTRQLAEAFNALHEESSDG